jgi:hypothetical protein
MSDFGLLMFSSRDTSRRTPLHSEFETLCSGLAIDLLEEVTAVVFIVLTVRVLCCVPMCHQA